MRATTSRSRASVTLLVVAAGVLARAAPARGQTVAPLDILMNGHSLLGGRLATDSLTLKATPATPAGGARIYLQSTLDYYDAFGEGLVLRGVTPLLLNATGQQNLSKTGGALSLGTLDAHSVSIVANGSPAITVGSTGIVTLPSLAGAGVQCVQADNSGTVTGTGTACGAGGAGGGSGISQLIGDVTAGPGSGSQAATIAANAVTDAKLRQSGPNMLIGNPTGSTANVGDIGIAAPFAFLSGNLTLTLDGTSLGLSGSTLQRKALTGAVTSAAGSATTAFGAAPALSGLFNTTTGSAVPTWLACTGAGQVIQDTGTAMACAALTLGMEAAPTGTGFWHITSGTSDGTARAVDVSSADVTNQLKAASFPALTGPVTTPGASLATSLSLGGGGISGTLALANEGAPTGSGFSHVTSGAWDPVARAVNLSSADVTSQLPLANIAQGGAASTNLLSWNGTAWAPVAAPASLPPSGSAGGDLAGSTYPNPVIAANVVTAAKIQQFGANTFVGVAGGSMANVAGISCPTPGTFAGNIGGTLGCTATIPATSAPLAVQAIGFGSAGGLLTGNASVLSWDGATAKVTGTIQSTALAGTAVSPVLIADASGKIGATNFFSLTSSGTSLTRAVLGHLAPGVSTQTELQLLGGGTSNTGWSRLTLAGNNGFSNPFSVLKFDDASSTEPEGPLSTTLEAVTPAGRFSAGPINIAYYNNGASTWDPLMTFVPTNYDILLGWRSAPATTDTGGWIWVRSLAGVPTGVPASSPTSLVPLVPDTADDRLYVYNGSWKPYGQYTGSTAGFLKNNSGGLWTVDTTAYVPTTRTLTMTAPMTCNGAGSCDLSSNVTIATPIFAGSAAGLVPSSGGVSTQFLNGAGAFATPAGTVYAGASPIVVTGTVVSCPTCGTSSGTVTGVFGTAGQVNVSPSSPNPTISLPNVGPGATTTGSAGIASVTTDAQGRFVSAVTATYLTGNQTIALTGDATGSGTTSIAVTNVNLPTGVTAAGFLDFTEIGAPSVGASGHLRVWGDSSVDNWFAITHAGTKVHAMRSDACFSGSAWVHSLADNGTVGCTQPNYTDLGGSVPAITATTGDVVATGPGSVSATIQSHVVSYGKIQLVSGVSLLGNSNAGTGTVGEIVMGNNLSIGSGVISVDSSPIFAGATIGSGSGVATLTSGVVGTTPLTSLDSLETNFYVSMSSGGLTSRTWIVPSSTTSALTSPVEFPMADLTPTFIHCDVNLISTGLSGGSGGNIILGYTYNGGTNGGTLAQWGSSSSGIVSNGTQSIGVGGVTSIGFYLSTTGGPVLSGNAIFAATCRIAPLTF